MITDMLSNKNLEPILIELLIRSRNIYVSLVFIPQSYFVAPKNMLDKTLRNTLLWKFQINKSFNKFQSIIYQILTLKTLSSNV